MKRIFIYFILGLGISSGLSYSVDLPYRVMEFTLALENGADCYLSRALLRLPNTQDQNPILRFAYKSDLGAAALTTIMTGAQVWALERLRKDSKTLGYLLLSLVIIVKSYAIYHNFKLWQRIN